MRLYKIKYDNDIKCGGCNYWSGEFFSVDPNGFKLDEDGRCQALCAECFDETFELLDKGPSDCIACKEVPDD